MYAISKFEDIGFYFCTPLGAVCSGKWSIYQDSDILNWLTIFKVLSDTITEPTSKLRKRAIVVLKQLPRKSKKSKKVVSTPLVKVKAGKGIHELLNFKM